MTLIIPAIGFLICIVSLFAAASPRTLLRLAALIKVSTGLRVFAAVIRITIGVLIVLAAPLTDYPAVLEVIGGVLVVVGVIILFLSNSMLQGIVDWALKSEPSTIRIGAVCGLVFGGFIVYASSELT